MNTLEVVHASSRSPRWYAAWLAVVGLWLLWTLVSPAVSSPRGDPLRADIGSSGGGSTGLRPLFDLGRDLPRAQVGVRRGLDEQPCAWSAAERSFRCNPESYAFVGPYAGWASGRARACTWLHPLPGGATTVLRWADVVWRGRLQVELALLDDVGPGAEVHLQIWAGEQRIAEAQVASGREPFTLDQPVQLPTASHGPLRLEVEARDHAWRLACAQVRIVPEPR
jgi:hypothetical protein